MGFIARFGNGASPFFVANCCVQVPVVEIVHFSFALLGGSRGVLSIFGINKVGCNDLVIFDHVATPIDQGGEEPFVRTGSVVDVDIWGERVVILVLLADGRHHEITPVIGVI